MLLFWSLCDEFEENSAASVSFVCKHFTVFRVMTAYYVSCVEKKRAKRCISRVTFSSDPPHIMFNGASGALS